MELVEEKDGSGRASEKLADQLGVSASTIEHARTVAKHADEDTKEKIKKGELSVNKAYQAVRKKKAKKTDEEEEEDLSDALTEGNKGNPGGLNFNHSDGHERPVVSVSAETDMDRRLIERYKEGKADGRKEGWERGFSDGVEAAFEKILEMIRDGLSADDIENNEVFADLSVGIINQKLEVEYKDGE